MIFHAFWSLWDFPLIFHALWAFSLTRLIEDSQGFGVSGGEEGRQRHAWESEFGRRGWLMGNMLIRGESSWLCMWRFSLSSLPGTVFLIRVLPPSFLALPVNERCLLFWRNPTLMRLDALCCLFFEISLWAFMLCGLMKLHAFRCIVFICDWLSDEISCFVAVVCFLAA